MQKFIVLLRHEKLFSEDAMEEALHELDIRINSCGISDCPADWSWNTAGFPDYDLWTVLRGKGKIICGGEPMEITAGKSFLLCPNTQYNASHDVNDRLLTLNVHFSPKNMTVFPMKTVCKTIPDTEFYSRLLRRVIFYYNKAENESAAEFLHCALTEFFGGSPKTPAPIIEAPHDAMIKKLTEQMDFAPESIGSLSQTAKIYGYSADYFGRLFSATVGISFSEYLMKAKISKAKLLLDTSDYTIEHISSLLGFYDCAYFCRQFRKIAGITTGEYRRHGK